MKEDAPAAKHKATALPGAPAPKPSANHSTAHAAAPAKPAHAPATDPATTALGQIRDLMWRNVGIMRSGKELSAAITFLENMQLPRALAKGLNEGLAAATSAHGATAAAPHSAASMAASGLPPTTRADHELHNLHCLASLMARSALARQESRGSHYRSDFPYRDDDEFQKHSIIQRDRDVTFEP